MRNTVDNLVKGLKNAAKEAATDIMDELGIDNCIARLQVLPAQIKAQETAVADARRGLEETREGLDLVKQIIVATVAEEKNGGGKARYSNAEARNAEVAQRLAIDPDYQKAKEVFRASEDEVSQTQFELSRLNNDFGATKIVGQLLAAKMNLLTGL